MAIKVNFFDNTAHDYFADDLGKVIKETNVLTLEQIKESLVKMVPAKKAALLENNIKAIELGYNF